MAMAIAEKTSKKQAIEAESCIIWYWTAMNLYKLEYVSEDPKKKLRTLYTVRSWNMIS